VTARPLTAPFLLPHDMVYGLPMRGFALALLIFAAAAGSSFAQDAETVTSSASETVTVAPKKPADVRADQLDSLFARLYKSGDNENRDGIEQKIWTLWMAADSPTAEVLLQQATRAMNEGAPRQSLSILNRLTGTYPDFAEAWNKRATLYFLMKRDEEALLDIQRVLDLEPRHFGALSGRGLIFQRQKKYSAALESFREALKINPGMDTIKGAVKEIERLEQGI
jgi:tetratricopeptide (TPR) repeat protein